MTASGRHYLLDLFECPAAALDDLAGLRELLYRAAEAAGARVVADIFHPFAPQGVTGVLAIEESHLSIHTWPERGYASLDFYTCGASEPERAFALIADALGARRVELLEVARASEPERTLKAGARRRLR